jgi:hypothetical protein
LSSSTEGKGGVEGLGYWLNRGAFAD